MGNYVKQTAYEHRMAALFAKVLIGRRRELGLSAEQVSLATGIELTKLTRIEAGDTIRPFWADVLKLMTALAIDPQELLDIKKGADDGLEAQWRIIVGQCSPQSLSYLHSLLAAFGKWLSYEQAPPE